METGVTQNQLVEVYKAIFEQENANHTTFIHALLGLTALLMVVTWWWNKIGATKYITSRVEKDIKQKIAWETEMSTRINEKVEEKIKSYSNEINMMKIDIYRSMGFSLGVNQFFAHTVYYYSEAIRLLLVAPYDEGQLIRGLAATIITDNGKNLTNKIHCKETVIEIISKLPNSLMIEKNQILEFVKACENI